MDEELLGPLRYCNGCGEWWPDDDEFFYFDKKLGRYSSPCKACQAESRQKLEGKACIEKGCNEPRKNIKEPRCEKHAKEHAQRYNASRRKAATVCLTA